MRIFGRRFLQFVGSEYVALGIFGLAALYSGSRNLLVLTALLVPFLLVVPLAPVLENGIQASCYGEPRAPWGCNLEIGEIQHARAILTLLCIISIAGGWLGIWGARTHRRRAGRMVWLTLTVVSIAVALWNLKSILFDSLPSNPI